MSPLHAGLLPWLISFLFVFFQAARPAFAVDSTNSALDLDRQLAAMETSMKHSLAAYRLPGDYRQKCAAHKQHDRAIGFFRELADSQPTNWHARLELSCAYVDKIPTCTGVASLLNQGALARKALDQADLVVAQIPDQWVAYYARGMNHLNWPRAFRHAPDAVKDFTRCLDIQAKHGGPGGRPYYLKVHVALGDALTKADGYKAARDAWQRGLEAFPNSTELKTRLAITNDVDQLRLVESQRSLEKPVDTSLSFLDDGK